MSNESTYEYGAERSRIDANEDENVSLLKNQISKLTTENEKYQQELHSLQCKLNVKTKMQSELQEANDILEQTVNMHQETLKLKIHNMEEKHTVEKQELFARLSDVENDCIIKKNMIEQLKLQLKENTQKLQEMQNVEGPISPIEDVSSLHQKIQELIEQLSQKEDTCKKLEIANQYSQNEKKELEEILSVTKNQLSEKNIQLEIIKDELTECRMELDAIKNTPTNTNFKGNSLFAEVEDRRQKILENMSSMKTKYYEAKKVVDIKDREIQSLKLELASILRKFEDDTAERLQQNANLSDKYKNRISELEIKLKDKIKMIKQLEEQKMPNNDAFDFFQSLIDSKRKNIEELEKELENVSINAVLEEEMKHKMGRQLRYWRCKAMSSDAQLMSIRMYLEKNTDIAIVELQKLLKESVSENIKFEEAHNSSFPSPEVINESTFTLDKLLLEKPDLSKNINESINDCSLLNYDKLKLSEIHKEQTEKTIIMSKASKVDESRFKNAPIIKKEKIDNSLSIISKFCTNASEFVKENQNTVNIKENFISNLKPAVKQAQEKDKKTLRFSEDTVDPEPRIPKRQQITKYPIIYVPSKSKNPK